jgi:hypothetical protein
MRLQDRLGALCGAAAVLLASLALFLDYPATSLNLNPTTSGSLMASAYADHTATARAGGWCGVAAAFLLLVFAARLHGALRARAAYGDWTPTLAPLGGAVLAGTVLIDAGIAFSVGERAGYVGDPAVIKTFFLYGWNSTFLYVPSLAAIVLATTVGAFRTGALPRWFGWVGVAVLAAMVACLILNGAGAATFPGLACVGFASLVLAVWPDGQRVRATRPSSQTGPSDS